MADLYPFQQQLLIDIESGGLKNGELMVMMSGRRAGKSYFNHLYNAVLQMKQIPNKLLWTRHDKHPLSLVATVQSPEDIDFINFLTEDDMVKVAEWCKECHCGKRTSFDTFRFKNEKQITMFLMKWAS